MKKSRRDRKNFDAGRRVGYAEGYAQGLRDGNPFIALAESLAEAISLMSDILTDPAIIEPWKQAQEGEDMKRTTDGRSLNKLSYIDLQNMGIPDETLDKKLFGSDYEYYQDPDNGDIYEFEGSKCIDHWPLPVFKVWFCED